MDFDDIRELINDIEDGMSESNSFATIVDNEMDRSMVMLLLGLGFAEIKSNPKILELFNKGVL